MCPCKGNHAAVSDGRRGRGPVIGPPNRSLPRGAVGRRPGAEGGPPFGHQLPRYRANHVRCAVPNRLHTTDISAGVLYRLEQAPLFLRLSNPHHDRPAGGGPPSARQAPAPAGRMEGPVSGRVGCGPAPPTIGRGGWVRGRGWRSGLPGGAGSAGRRSRAPPLACCVAAAGAAARLPLGPFPRAAAWPERAGGAAACPARPFSHVFLGWPGDGLGFSLPLRPPAPSRAEGGGPWPGLPASSSLEQGLALASPHQPLAPSRAEGGGVGFGRGPAAPSTGRCPGRTGKGGPWARSCVAEGLRRQRQGDCLGCGRRGATPASSPLLLLLAAVGAGPPARAGGAGPAHSPVWRLGLPFPFPLRPPAPSRAGGGGGGGRGLCRREEAPASPAPVPESGAGFGGPGCRGRRRGCLPWPPGPSGPCPRSCGLRARADNYRGDHLRRLRAASSPSGPVGGLARAVRGHPAGWASPPGRAAWALLPPAPSRAEGGGGGWGPVAPRPPPARE
ncbi:hypothetical protein C7M84_018112 [Penaeus vannamei]|uniref:Uncharacterized protein n=1 Tax=Penaeus vannamei TaxID=6689 RepID=A0A3R7NQD8_PENVA|nr:hypothetical protein C7M84_018112 [Penaeus vannamei]